MGNRFAQISTRSCVTSDRDSGGNFLSPANLTVIVGRHMRAAGVDRCMPRAGRRQQEENERDWFVRAVNEKDEIVILDRLALIGPRRSRCLQDKAQTFVIRVVPLLVGHLAAIRREPYDGL